MFTIFNHWGQISKENKTSRCQTLNTDSNEHFCNSAKTCAVFPPECALIDSLKDNLLPFINLSWGGESLCAPGRYLQTPSDALKRSSSVETFRKHVTQIKHFAARSTRLQRLALLFSSRLDWLPLLSLGGGGEWRGISDVRFVLGRGVQFGSLPKWKVICWKERKEKIWVESDHKAVGGLVLCKYYRCWDTGCHDLMRNPVWAFPSCNAEHARKIWDCTELFAYLWLPFAQHNIFLPSISIVSHLFSPHTIQAQRKIPTEQWRECSFVPAS